MNEAPTLPQGLKPFVYLPEPLGADPVFVLDVHVDEGSVQHATCTIFDAVHKNMQKFELECLDASLCAEIPQPFRLIAMESALKEAPSVDSAATDLFQRGIEAFEAFQGGSHE